MSELKPFDFGVGPKIVGHRHFASVGRAAVIQRLRALQMRQTEESAAAAAEHCDFCQTSVAHEHRHILDTEGRRIMCACEACVVRVSGEAKYTLTGRRTVRIADFQLADELWGRFGIPVGLAFFFRSSAVDGVIGLYPSPLGATEAQLDTSAWDDLVAANPVLAELEGESEALLVNRMSDPREHYIVPIDRCYELVGLIKRNWQGISGGPEADQAIAQFFVRLLDQVSA